MTDEEKNLRVQDAYDQAMSLAQSDRPTYAGTYDQQIQDIYDKINNREPFSYDLNGDPLYQQMKDRYIQGGKLAMKDTMGQAAALTGGYGSSYGQAVGQQQYDKQLQDLAAQIPGLYQTAYGVYQDQGDDLLNQYNMLGQMRDTEYGRYQDDLANWQYDQQNAYNRWTDAYNRVTNEENTAYAREQDAFNRQQQLYSNLYTLILKSGYTPSDGELQSAGMSRAQANALAAEYQRAITPVVSGGSSGGGGGSGGGSSGGSSGSSSGGSALDDYRDTWGFKDVAGVVQNMQKDSGVKSTDVNKYLQEEVKAGTITKSDAQYIKKDAQVRDRM